MVGFMCCQVEISETGRSLEQRDHTVYGVSECNRRKPEKIPKFTKATDT